MPTGPERAIDGQPRRQVYSTATGQARRRSCASALQPDDRIAGPAIVEEFGSTTVVYPGLAATVDEFANLLVRRTEATRDPPDPNGLPFDPLTRTPERRRPIVVEIVEGTLAAVEAEVEAAIERTARSPMIREARDFRGGIHDRRCAS